MTTHSGRHYPKKCNIEQICDLVKLLMEDQQKRERANCIGSTEKRRTDSIPEGADLGGATEERRADGN